ncbi:unknown [Orgyia pseudotsugata multiple nucleopolyhedrovirus]|uniref:Uncharacterized 11.2 kDa protein n=1 Tax=Orgyia pseudotsugata multicapsid polyhedrosis virus TaxID=262177 RepID=Y117_NPVOP|nr:hypothetical protein OpmnVgp117 [Orgyia pseudotsugata multiple nucleopolyhedrovirus]O10356.1 RecName: Full=Uncharacterized 11.2 kDa protein [Orgyia pseudotsugata multiple nucleopolyhedrovirus]pir/T10386/ hypothetical protein 117 - Orgyia pseudotsugata nuclear polyhedrosis virus [Orgyia pseudotsugata single capsid nuclopolyhedrovirus]AAC59116.1 unknown [Orgyia pseudotsugata multiple nucleopolyhedrovirus]
MPLTANVLYVSNKLDFVFDLQKCFVVEQLQCYNRDSLALVVTSDSVSCPSELVHTKDTFERSQLELLEKAEFSVQIVDHLRLKIRHIVNKYNETFAD